MKTPSIANREQISSGCNEEAAEALVGIHSDYPRYEMYVYQSPIRHFPHFAFVAYVINNIKKKKKQNKNPKTKSII